MTPVLRARLEHPVCRAAWSLGLLAVTWQLVSPDPYGGDFPLNDKLAHGLLYATLGLTGIGIWSRQRASLLLLGLAIHGLAVEWIQHRVPGRSLEFADWLADLLGLFLALIAWRLLDRDPRAEPA